jgi:16S rRNA (adenine1518-N6/adenine1519-N6)-dimethyltransferase
MGMSLKDFNRQRNSRGNNSDGAARDHMRAMGQNFLKSESVARRIAESLEGLENAHVLELGAGPGRLSRQITARAARTTLLELDTRWAAHLEETFRADQRVAVIRGDILRFDFETWAGECAPLNPIVAGNIPYNITSNLLHRLIEARESLGTVVLMLQEEVARKITSAPGGKLWAMLPVFIACYSTVESLFKVGADNFSPRPKVDSAVVRLDFKGGSPLRAKDDRLFRALVKRLFLERRKQIQKVLRSDSLYRLGPDDLERMSRSTGVDLSRRPEELTVDDFIKMSDFIAVCRSASSENDT